MRCTSRKMCVIVIETSLSATRVIVTAANLYGVKSVRLRFTEGHQYAEGHGTRILGLSCRRTENFWRRRHHYASRQCRQERHFGEPRSIMAILTLQTRLMRHLFVGLFVLHFAFCFVSRLMDRSFLNIFIFPFIQKRFLQIFHVTCWTCIFGEVTIYRIS